MQLPGVGLAGHGPDVISRSLESVVLIRNFEAAAITAQAPCGPGRPGNPRPGESGPRFPVPAESGIGDSLFPGQIGNRGFPPRFPAKNSGNRGNRESDFLSDEYQLQWTRNILVLSREYHASAFTGSMRLLFRVRDSEREHAAVSDEHQLQ